MVAMNRRMVYIVILSALALSTLLLAGGTWIVLNGRLNHLNMKILSKPDSYFFGMAIFFLVIFSMAFLAGVLALWAMCTSDNLVIYAWIIETIILALVINGVVCISYKDEILNVNVRPTLEGILKNQYGQTSLENSTNSYDTLQKDFHCCGADNGTVDWVKSAWRKGQPTHVFVPDSCCPEPLDQYMCNAAVHGTITENRDKYVWTQDCNTTLLSHIRIYFWSIFAITLVFGVGQVLLLIALLYHIQEQEAAFYPLVILICWLKCMEH